MSQRSKTLIFIVALIAFANYFYISKSEWRKSQSTSVGNTPEEMERQRATYDNLRATYQAEKLRQERLRREQEERERLKSNKDGQEAKLEREKMMALARQLVQERQEDQQKQKSKKSEDSDD